MSRLIQHGRTRSMIAYLAMVEAMDNRSENEWLDMKAVIPMPLMTWPSTIKYIDKECGGFYGLVTFAASKGTGKTMLALSSAIEAAASGSWQVCFFASEDDSDGLSVRFNNYMNAHPYCEAALENLHIFQTGRGQTPQELTIQVAASIDTDRDTPVLIVIDSINSMVEMSNYRYLEGLTEFGLWAMLARRISRGCASFLFVSEVNKRGEIRGEKLPYWSDQVLLMKRCVGTADLIEMTLDKSRRTSGVGDMGKYLRIWDHGTFVSEDEMNEMRGNRLRVVSGGGGDRPGDDDMML